MKIPRTMNQQYAIIRAADAEQRQRKTCAKRETVSQSVCRRLMGAHNPYPLMNVGAPHGDVNPHILPISIPTENAINPSNSIGCTTPHACPVMSQSNNTFSW